MASAVPSERAQTLGKSRVPGRRRKSSSLGGEPPGDTSAPAFATTERSLKLQHSPASSISRTAEPTGKRGRKRRKIRGLLQRWKYISLRHTWLNPLVIVLTILGVFITNPTPSNPVYPAVILSYPLRRKAGEPLDAPIQYGKGAHDFTFVAFYTIVLSFTREFCMQRIIRPLALKAGIRSRAKQSRFMEQFYTAMYFSIFGPFGLYVMAQTPVWYFNTQGMYEGFPHRTHLAVVKAYYLLQASYWAQQMIVMLLMQEKPRKDFKELVAHHLITLALIWLSYRFHFTYMGLAVYITHDVSDFFLASSKVINYMQLPVVGPFFGFFIAIWGYCRHYINLKIIFSLLPLPVPALMGWTIRQLPFFLQKSIYASPILSRVTRPMYPDWHSKWSKVGPYELNWETQQYKCWISQWITFLLLAALQSVNIFWSFLILRILVRFLRTGEEKDDRSDSDDDKEEEEEEAEEASHADEDKSKTLQSVSSPTVLLNGTPLAATGSETPANTNTRRTPRKSK